jgi:hypothetical protein
MPVQRSRTQRHSEDLHDRAGGAGGEEVGDDVASASIPRAMRAAQVYPDIWDPADASLEGWLLGELDGARGFYRAAATAGHAVIQTIC